MSLNSEVSGAASDLGGSCLPAPTSLGAH